ncbi:hypothetical protein [Rhizobium sp. Leaf341]|uniref:hypothetical protein n=1 Tax=Rhizobium sp. Leaf341 TaxID=1736344 RepID=UPI0012E36217|nr:hypothetical protein [Rhizobium sp. Leaf341]
MAGGENGDFRPVDQAAEQDHSQATNASKRDGVENPERADSGDQDAKDERGDEAGDDAVNSSGRTSRET